jgi:hypothetical protein
MSYRYKKLKTEKNVVGLRRQWENVIRNQVSNATVQSLGFIF